MTNSFPSTHWLMFPIGRPAYPPYASSSAGGRAGVGFKTPGGRRTLNPRATGACVGAGSGDQGLGTGAGRGGDAGRRERGGESVRKGRMVVAVRVSGSGSRRDSRDGLFVGLLTAVVAARESPTGLRGAEVPPKSLDDRPRLAPSLVGGSGRRPGSEVAVGGGRSRPKASSDGSTPAKGSYLDPSLEMRRALPR